MTQMRGRTPDAGAWESGDVDLFVEALRRVGPMPLRELGEESEIAGWPAERVRQAVVSAWSENRIYVDAGDLLVAL